MAANLREVQIAEVIHPNFVRNSENTFVAGVMLIAKRADRPLQTYRLSGVRSKKTSMDANYDRMVVIGELQSSNCFAIITRNAQESSQMLRTAGLTVGCIVNAHEPVFTGLCLGNDRNNPIFEVYRSLEVVEDNVPNLIPFPVVANPVTTALTKFNLNNVPLSFIQVNVMSPTCSGFLCDRRISKTSNCACIQKSAVSSWALTCRIFSRDVANLENDPFSGEQLQCLQLSKIFCEMGTLALPASQVQLQNLRNAVAQVVNFVNDNGGWNVTGFFKSGVSEENIALNISKIQICRIRPTVVVPENLKYSALAAGRDNAQVPEQPPLMPQGQV